MQAFIQGLAFGLVLAALIGPVFFALIQVSAEKGFKFAAQIAIGVIISDAIYIGIAYTGSSFFTDSLWFEKGFGLIGGLLVIAFGVSALLKRKNDFKVEKKGKLRSLIQRQYMAQGFLLNSLNPFVFFFWLGAVGMVNLKEDFGSVEIGLFFSGTLFMVFATDLFKAYVAFSIRKIMKPEYMLWLNRISGIGLIAFGISLLWRIA